MKPTQNLEHIARSLLDGTLAPEELERNIESDPCWTEKNSGSPISAETLTELVRASYSERRLWSVLAELTDAVVAASVSDAAFDAMLRHPNEDTRQQLIINLSHKRLTEVQLRILCDEQPAFECFFELAILYYAEKEHSLEKFAAIVHEFARSKHSYLLPELISELTADHTASSDDKHEYLLKLTEK